jgi:serine/threonine protein kinase
MARLVPQYDQWQKLGQGGMGAVYQARQISLDRTVAVKVLPPEAADDEEQFIERFKNEARTMAKMNHPAIVGVIDFGETSEGQLYFVMEFVDGTDVAKMIQEQGRLPPEHALAITAHVCDALQYAHDQNVIHRDIKPANILVNRGGEVKVADFGLAKMNDPAATIGLTRSGMTMGTPDFVAPEALMMGVTVDHRADLYAIGVMLYQMITGKIPRGVFSPATKVVAGLDPRFDAIITRAMAEDREDRYPNAAQIRRDLDAILAAPHVEPKSRVFVPPPQAELPPAPEPERWVPPRVREQAAAPPPRTGPNLVTIVLCVLAVGAVAAFFLTQKPESVPTTSNATPATATASPPAGKPREPAATAPAVTSPAAPSSAAAPAATVIATVTAPPPSTIPSADPTLANPNPAPMASVPAVSQPVSTPVASGAAPGPWHDLFAENLISSSGLEPEPGGSPGAGARYRAPGRIQSVTTAVYKDCIVRARFGGKWSLAPSLIIRHDRSRNTTYVDTGTSNYSAYLRAHYNPNSYRSIATGEMDSPMLRDQTMDLELKAVGNRFTFSKDGKVLVEGTNSDYATGNVGFVIDQNTTIEKLEVMSLDDSGGGTPSLAGSSTATQSAGLSASMPADPRVAQLEAGFQARYATDVQKPYDTAVASLNESYVANGIARARASAQSRGNQVELSALDAEKNAVEKGPGVPTQDAADTPAPVRALRTTYRAALAKLESERAKNAAPLYDLYRNALDLYASELTRSSKIAEAQKIKSLRDEIAGKKAAMSALGQPFSGARPGSTKLPAGTYEVTLDWVGNGFSIKDTSYRPKSAPLSGRKPPHVTKIPDSLSSEARYALLAVGPVKNDKMVAVLVDDASPDRSRLWVDSNGNGDLTDDPTPAWTRRNSSTTPDPFWSGNASVTADFGDQKRELGMRFYHYDRKDKSQASLSYYRDFGLAGKATIAGKTYEMLVSDNTSRGDFMDSGDTWIKFDIDGDGKFDFRTELFDMKGMIELQGESYEIVGLKPGGASFQIRESKGKRR